MDEYKMVKSGFGQEKLEKLKELIDTCTMAARLTSLQAYKLT